MALRNSSNMAGIICSAFFLSVGGGTTRDFLLQNDSVFWIDNPVYPLIILAAIPIVFMQNTLPRLPAPSGQILSSSGTAVFIALGVQIANEAGCTWLVIAFLGVLTGIGGGIIRQAVFERESLSKNHGHVVTATVIALLYLTSVRIEANETGSILMMAVIHFMLTTQQKHCMNYLPVRLSAGRSISAKSQPE